MKWPPGFEKKPNGRPLPVFSFKPLHRSPTAPNSADCFLRLKIQKKLNQGISWVWKDLVSLHWDDEYYWQILSHWFDIHYLHSSWLESFQLQLLLHLDSCWNEWHLKSESLVKLLYPPFLSVKQAAGSDSGTARYFTHLLNTAVSFAFFSTVTQLNSFSPKYLLLILQSVPIYSFHLSSMGWQFYSSFLDFPQCCPIPCLHELLQFTHHWQEWVPYVEGQEVGACDQSDCSPVAIHTVHVILLNIDYW